jgi:ectoine hydroxylase-related dioxygenase (phytanoyl-CoA dioxygenase family)
MAQIFQLNQKYVIDSQKIISIPMKAGDVLAFNSFLLHKSGLNKSKRARWTVQTRYADFLSKDYVARGWQHGTHRGKVTFCDLHAEKIMPIKGNAQDSVVSDLDNKTVANE